MITKNVLGYTHSLKYHVGRELVSVVKQDLMQGYNIGTIVETARTIGAWHQFPTLDTLEKV